MRGPVHIITTEKEMREKFAGKSTYREMFMKDFALKTSKMIDILELSWKYVQSV